jgi:Tfp pilus assembly protein FimT
MRHASTSGHAMAALLVGLSVMSIMLDAALPAWQTAITREREAEPHISRRAVRSGHFAVSTTIRRNVSTQYRCPRKAASAGA